MGGSICDVPGVLVGHAQDDAGGTGCTVVLPAARAVCGVDVAGGAPGTRELDALHPVNLVDAVDAVYLGGGSAFGLAAADGVMRWCEEQGRGVPVGPAGVVPVVPGAVVFDLFFGDSKARPAAPMGYAACAAATAAERRTGNVGVGTGATLGKAAGPQSVMKGGVGMASRTMGPTVVGALVVVNCFGDIIDPSNGAVIAGTRDPATGRLLGTTACLVKNMAGVNPFTSNTTLGVIATNALLTKASATKVAKMAHDGLARTISPIHTPFDGDTIFAMSTGSQQADLAALGSVAAEVMAEAVLNAVRTSKTSKGIVGLANGPQKSRL
ncbi:putative aminopeptidase [Diplonema papillatum]|nr:putative aminopeptidase [Diplonema papillatum]